MNIPFPKKHLLTFVFAALAVSQLSGCGGAAAKIAAVEVFKAPVEVSTLARGAIEAHYTATAPLRTERDALVVAEVQGSVLKLLVEEGDRVSKGQAMAQLDVDRAVLSVAQSQAVVARLENDHRRLERLGERDLVSRDMRDQSRFELQSQQASLNLAQLNVEKATIRAPFDGVVTARNVKLGQLVKANDAMFSVGDFSLLTAVMTVPERQSSALKQGQAVTVNFDAFGVTEFAGKILRISPVVDAASGTLEVTVSVSDPKAQLRPGLFARLNVLVERREQALLLPKAALVGAGSGNQVWVVDGDQAKLTTINVGLDANGVVEVLGGLTPEMRVVVQGQEGLSEGSKVQVLKTAATQVAAK